MYDFISVFLVYCSKVGDFMMMSVILQCFMLDTITVSFMLITAKWDEW